MVQIIKVNPLEEKLNKKKFLKLDFNKRYNKKENKNWIRYLQSVSINKKTYESLRQAASLTGESRTNITRKCLNSNNSNYAVFRTTILSHAL